MIKSRLATNDTTSKIPPFVFVLEKKWETLLLILFLLFNFSVLLYFGLTHDGFYQGEEGAQYINMKRFWEEPSIILGNWAKTGWKLLYVIPALFGKQAVLWMNCFFSTLCSFFVYLICKKEKLNFPLIGPALLICSALWMEVSFRNYSEVTAALCLIAGCYYFLNQKYIIAGLIFSYSLIVRQELYVVLFPLGIYWLYKKEFYPAFLLALFPFLNNLWGFLKTGDLLYLLHNASETAATYKNGYMRAGFDHYFVMSGVCFGYLTIFGIGIYLVLLFYGKTKMNLIIFSSFFIFFILDCLFNLKTYIIGTPTAGNLRYMMIIAPLAACLAAFGWEQFYKLQGRWKWAFALIPMLIFVAYTQTYPHNWLERGTHLPRLYTPLIVTLLGLLLLFIPHRLKQVFYATFILLCFSSIYIFKQPIYLNAGDENTICKEIVDFCKKYNFINTRPIYQSLAMFNYFCDRTPSQYPKGINSISKDALDNSPPGSIIIWDTHFGRGYGAIELDYFETQLDKFMFVKQWITQDQRVEFRMFERINK